MGSAATCGRYPTFGEVLAYYGRDDFLDFLLRTCETRRVFLVMPKQGHWEPDRARDSISAGSRAELRDLVRGRILSEHAGVSEEARLPFYPSFHQSLERWAPGHVGGGEIAGRDVVLEADQPTWRASFQDVQTLVDVLCEEEVPHLLKFSGHRSLHVVLPCAHVALHAATFGDSRAHATAILRMPYSLNEDTGLVSLPLRVEALRLMAEIAADRWGPGPGLEYVQALAEMGTAITDLLLLAVGTSDRHRRRSFLLPLCLIGDERALEVYVEALADTYRDNPRWATRALLKLGEQAVPALLEAAASDEARRRRYAIRCLGHLGDPRAHDTVVEALRDPDQAICRQAVLALRHFAREADLPALAGVMRGGRADVRPEAREVLLSLGEAGRATLLALALQEGEPASAGWLWEQGDPRGREAVLAAAGRDGPEWEAAVLELARRPLDPETRKALVQALPRAEWGTQEAAAQALAGSGDPEVLAALLALAESKDLVDRKVAARALSRWDEPRAMRTLVRLLADPRRSLRQQAVEALLDAGERAREALEAAGQDPRLARAEAYLSSVRDGLEVRRRFAAGARLDRGLLALIARGPVRIWEEAGAHLAAGAGREEIDLLLETRARGSSLLRWVASNLLKAIEDSK